MPRDTKAKIQAGTLRKFPWAKIPTGTPAASSFLHLFQSVGSPIAGAYTSFAAAALTKQQVLGGTTPSVAAGYLCPKDPTAPNKNYLTKGFLRNMVAAGKGTLYLIDWLVTYRSIDANSAAAQNMLSSVAGTDARPRTSSDRTILFADTSVVLGAGAANLTVTYTSTKSGLPSARSTGAQALTASAPVGRIPHAFMFLPLQADDPGVASIQTAQLSAGMGAGSQIALNLANILAEITITSDLDARAENYSDDTDGLIEIPTGAALSLIWQPTAATASQQLQGNLNITEADLAAA